MKLSILGTEYDYGKALQKAKLLDQAALFTAAGIGVRSIQEMLFKLDEAKTLEDAVKVSEQPDVLIATQGLVFLCRRYAGEKVSFEDTAVAWDDLKWIVEDSDMQAEPPPLSEEEASEDRSSGSGSSGSPASAKKSRTSKPRSTAASS